MLLDSVFSSSRVPALRHRTGVAFQVSLAARVQGDIDSTVSHQNMAFEVNCPQTHMCTPSDSAGMTSQISFTARVVMKIHATVTS